MNFYIYKGHAPLGQEPLGTENKNLWWDLKTVRGAIKRARRFFGNDFSLYTYTNFYDSSTFKQVNTTQETGE